MNKFLTWSFGWNSDPNGLEGRCVIDMSEIVQYHRYEQMINILWKSGERSSFSFADGQKDLPLKLEAALDKFWGFAANAAGQK